MKILSFICVIVVMVLSMMPCADVHEDLNSKTIKTITAADSGHGRPMDDACTPFCHCSCCASSAVVKIIFSLSAPFPLNHNSRIHYFEGNYVDVSSSIWQPPKIV